MLPGGSALQGVLAATEGVRRLTRESPGAGLFLAIRTNTACTFLLRPLSAGGFRIGVILYTPHMLCSLQTSSYGERHGAGKRAREETSAGTSICNLAEVGLLGGRDRGLNVAVSDGHRADHGVDGLEGRRRAEVPVRWCIRRPNVASQRQASQMRHLGLVGDELSLPCA